MKRLLPLLLVFGMPCVYGATQPTVPAEEIPLSTAHARIYQTNLPSPFNDPIRLTIGPHLFLDDYLIASSTGITRVVSVPKRDTAIPNPVVTGKEDGCGVIGRHYFKGRSTEPFLIHPVRPELSRLFTKGEHARIKGIPQEILNGVSETTAQEMAGQSVGYGQFESVGEEIGGCLLPVRNNILKFPKPQQALDKLEDDKHSAPFVVQIGTMSLFN